MIALSRVGFLTLLLDSCLSRFGDEIIFNNKGLTDTRSQVYCEYIRAMSPPVDSTCWSYNTIAELNPEMLQKGCDYNPCEEVVCACDPYCCEMSWDMSCRGYEKNGKEDNAFIGGCSASKLCCDPSETEGGLSDATITGVGVVGPRLCEDKRTIGYSTFDDIKRDMALQYSSFSETGYVHKVYVLCPNTVFDLSKGSIIPSEQNIAIKCGEDGSSANSCTFRGGLNHIIIERGASLTNILFQGIKMTQSRESSIVIRTENPAAISFVDCHWNNNFGNSIVDFMYETTDRRVLSSNMEFWNELIRKRRSSLKYIHRNLNRSPYNREPFSIRNLRSNSENEVFSTMQANSANFSPDNEQKLGIVLSIAGHVQFNECVFSSNQVGAVTLGAAKGGSIAIDPRTTFYNNTNSFSTIFIDGVSTLTVPKYLKAEDNKSNFCNDIFAEQEGASCLASGGYDGASCYGFCCDFSLNCYMI